MLQKIKQIYFYANFHIALGSVFWVMSYYLILDIPIDWNYTLLVFGSTLSMYTIHRLIGLWKIKNIDVNKRFRKLKSLKLELLVSLLVGACCSLVGIYNIKEQYITHLIPAVLISLAYVIPFLPQKKRLRDLPYIKLFLIAWGWAWVGVAIPAGIHLYEYTILLFLDAFFFFLAITIPFDIRDLEIDKNAGIYTLVQGLGTIKSIEVSSLMIFISTIILLVLYVINCLSISIICVLLISNFITLYFIRMTKLKSEDIHYTGYLDGMILLRSVLVCIVILFVNL